MRTWKVVAAGVLAAAALVSPASAAEPLTDPSSFAAPPDAVRPAMRWWWGPMFGGAPGALSTAETRKELGYLADAGFKRVEIAFNSSMWSTPEQRENLEVALDEASKRGVTIDMTVGAVWPVRSPNTAPGTGLSEQELQYGRASVAGGATFSGDVPLPFDTNSTARNAKLFAVTAARVVQAGPPVTEVNTPPAASTVLDPTSLVDLTAQVRDGKLTWTAPAGGDWIVFGLWARETSEGVVDHFRRESIDAATSYVEQNQFSASAAELLKTVGGSFFEDSLEIDADGIFWTPKMAEQFASRRGYELTKYLPLVFQQGVHRYWVPETLPIGDFELPDGGGARVRHDYAETLTDLYVDEHLKPLQEWASKHGVKFRAQAAFGQNLDPIRSARELARMGGLADDESLNAGDEIPNDLGRQRQDVALRVRPPPHGRRRLAPGRRQRGLHGAGRDARPAHVPVPARRLQDDHGQGVGGGHDHAAHPRLRVPDEHRRRGPGITRSAASSRSPGTRRRIRSGATGSR